MLRELFSDLTSECFALAEDRMRTRGLEVSRGPRLISAARVLSFPSFERYQYGLIGW